MPLAVPRPLGGTVAASIFATHGKPALSPKPSSSRITSSMAKVCVKPTMMVADAHTMSPAASTRCAP